MQTDPYGFDEPREFRLPRRRRWRRTGASLAGGVVAIAFLSAVGAQMLQTGPAPDAPALRKAEPIGPLAPRIALRAGAELLDANYSLGGRPTAFSLEPISDPGLQPATTLASAQMTDLRGRLSEVERPLAPPQAAPMPVPRPLDLAMAAPEETFSPLPPRRPADLAPPPAARGPVTADAEKAPAEPAQPRTSRALRGGRTTVAKAEPPKEPGFFEKLFGGAGGSSNPAMAYAAPDGGLTGGGSRLTGVAPSELASNVASDRFTAVYDISARMVYLPDGTRLEAHSGLGEYMDKPSFAHLRMRGVTPPHVYDLREREALFHGVRAIRLTPIGGAGAIHGRAGLLAHTYMLGPNGQSNGCVSFRDYQRFLNAFLSGQVKRLKVVASL